MSITPRVRRVRDRCLGVLAARRGLPAPNATYLAAADDSLSLEDILDRWATQQPVVAGAALGESPRRASNVGSLPRRRRMVALLLGAVAAGAIVGVAVRWPDLTARRAAARDGVQWTVLTDSIAAAEREKLLDLSEAPDTMAIPISAGDLAALVLGRADRWRWAVHAGVAARVDSVLWLRGTAPDGRRFLLTGTVSRARAGHGELRLLGLWVDSAAVSPSAATASLRGLGMFGVRSAGVIRFELPRYVLGFRLRGRTATAFVGEAR